MSIYKLVDQSSQLGKTHEHIVTTKNELLQILRNYLKNLFDSVNADEDSRLFWATYSIFVIKKDGIYLCSNMGTVYPLFDVDVKKSDNTKIIVRPYKIDGYNEYEVTNLQLSMEYCFKNKRKKFKMISPLEAFGWKLDTNQKYEGQIYVKTNFTGWNYIKVKIDREALIKEEESK
ncbi:hypothetical protein H012_gp061 [Acanthamoeba polyphaga moumouvirus]|uniref:Uncharacterized protein n=1 Tax=Acanthamoeba polyphaga moumouvirus TaxID=1269028 RepID=L7RDF2_9VIRU|nr:hypothetical protein H012_gp061 [Acanthamoeba polyphaga moumouvirus]AGC02387.1 hypothetical protein Moumou_00872 [Acanthamoeba polyphaga moumouvirus]